MEWRERKQSCTCYHLSHNISHNSVYFLTLGPYVHRGSDLLCKIMRLWVYITGLHMEICRKILFLENQGIVLWNNNVRKYMYSVLISYYSHINWPRWVGVKYKDLAEFMIIMLNFQPDCLRAIYQINRTHPGCVCLGHEGTTLGTISGHRPIAI